MRLHLHPYPPHCNTVVDLPTTGLVVVHGANGSGKCLPGTALLNTPQGALPIAQVVTEKISAVQGLVGGKATFVPVVRWIECGPKRTLRINLINGTNLVVACTHPIKTDRGFVLADQISTEDYVACASKLLPGKACTLPQEELTLIGLMLGDGCNTEQFMFCAENPDKVQLFKDCAASVFTGCRFSVAHRRVMLLSCADRKAETLRFVSFCQERGINLAAYFKSNTQRLLRAEAAPSFETLEAIEQTESVNLRSFKNSLWATRTGLEWLSRHGLAGTRSAEKRVPALGYDEKQAAALLRGLFTTDGYVGLSTEVSYSSASYDLVVDLQRLLLTIGVASSLRRKLIGEKTYYNVVLTGACISAFARAVDLPGKKGARLREMVARLESKARNPNSGCIPWSLCKNLRERSAQGQSLSSWRAKERGMSPSTYLGFGGDTTIANSDIQWIKVESVQVGDRVQTFDLEVDTSEHIYLFDTAYGHNSTLVESYAAALWGKSLRGAAAWRSEADRIDLSLPGLTVSRTPSSLLVNGETALTTAKAQQRLTSIVGDFAMWQRTRVFDADLTARFGAETDGERKKLLERLLGLEQLDAGLRKLREDLRAAEGKQTASEAQARQVRAVLAEQPAPLPGVADLGSQLTATSAALETAERAASEMAKKEGKLAERLSRLQQDITALHAGQCPTCRQSVPGSTLRRLHEEAAEARSERIAQEAARRAAADESAALQASVRRLREVQAAAQRAAATAGRRAELETQQGIVEEEARLHGRMVSRLKQLEAFIVDARPKLLADSLAILEAAASAWIPGLQLRIIDDGLSVKLGARKYKELNEGHRRLCDLAVLLGLSGMGDAKVKGGLFLDGALHGLDEDRQDAVATLLETVAQRELVIVLTCVEDVAQRLRGTRIKVANGTVT